MPNITARKARNTFSNFPIPVYRKCFYGEPLLGVLTGLTSVLMGATSVQNIFLKILDNTKRIRYISIVMELSNCVKIFKALANEQRLKIFIMIYRGCCVPEGKGHSEFKIENKACCPVAGVVEKAFTKVCDCMKLSRSTVSHHFKELQNAGLITCERDGQMYRCKVNEEAINTIKDFLK